MTSTYIGLDNIFIREIKRSSKCKSQDENQNNLIIYYDTVKRWNCSIQRWCAKYKYIYIQIGTKHLNN